MAIWDEFEMAEGFQTANKNELKYKASGETRKRGKKLDAKVWFRNNQDLDPAISEIVKDLQSKDKTVVKNAQHRINLVLSELGRQQGRDFGFIDEDGSFGEQTAEAVKLIGSFIKDPKKDSTEENDDGVTFESLYGAPYRTHITKQLPGKEMEDLGYEDVNSSYPEDGPAWVLPRREFRTQGKKDIRQAFKEKGIRTTEDLKYYLLYHQPEEEYMENNNNLLGTLGYVLRGTKEYQEVFSRDPIKSEKAWERFLQDTGLKGRISIADRRRLRKWHNDGRWIGNNDGLPQLERPSENITYDKRFRNMERKYQQGGAMEDPQQQIIALVQAAAQGDQQAQQTIQQIQEAAQQGDPQAQQILSLIQQIIQGMQGGEESTPMQEGVAPEASAGMAPAQMARHGAKLRYLNRLKGNCPDGYEMKYFKVGGKVCKKCQQSTAFGDRSHTPTTTRMGQGHPNYNKYGTHSTKKYSRNVFSAFGDEGRKKPTNVGLVGHTATGNTGLMRTKENFKNNKHTAFGGLVKRSHRGAKASSIGGIKKNSYPKGLNHSNGIRKIKN